MSEQIFVAENNWLKFVEKVNDLLKDKHFVIPETFKIQETGKKRFEKDGDPGETTFCTYFVFLEKN